MNAYGKLCSIIDRDSAIVIFYLYLAAALITICQLIQHARTRTAGTSGPPPSGSRDTPIAGRS
jgi:hypothetical protein